MPGRPLAVMQMRAPPPLGAGLPGRRSLEACLRVPACPGARANGDHVNKAENRGSGGLRSWRGKLQHVLAVAAVVADAADVGGDHRQTREHRLGHDDAKALRLREVEEDVRFDRLCHPVGLVAGQESHGPEGRAPTTSVSMACSPGRRRRRRASHRRLAARRASTAATISGTCLRAMSLPAAASRTRSAKA